VSVWFFYLLTAALNSLFVLSYTPGLPTQVQSITPALSLLGAILLGLLVPVSIAALERARQVADVARLSLLVEVETLRGIVAQGAAHCADAHTTDASAPKKDPAPEHIAAIAESTPEASRSYTCKYCTAPGLTASELMTHGRLHARYGSCEGAAIQTRK
jgi:hypothetical protein